MNPIRVWYCARCRLPLRVFPTGAMEPSCRCAVPVLPTRGPTLIWDAAPPPERAA